ncbi:HD-GYP domain-containing protein [Rugamonas apoptosis]|uniref:HD domain-containing protein n=1 Tax=Rugamonas apoptosis TaxID=2758570 RepID=A0A7W2IMD3_9BURK|nr:HD domain-containing phosphohydrolase [Rugamonas apoptosis]MBA5689568.1 HD domain-containing protein [Rugamonas apoptosis]
MKADLIPPQEIPGESPHYILAVTEMGDTREVLASADIYASNGMKLLAKGARVDSLQYARLTRHRLSAPLDNMLTTDRPVDGNFLALEVDRIIAQDAIYRRIVTRAGDPRMLKHSLVSLTLPPPVQLRLTVMSEQRKEIYQHCLRVAIIAFAVAQRLRLPEEDYGTILLAALCHDMGEMHTDPDILDLTHSITTEERRFVHVHPITGYVLLHEMPDFPAAAAQAILQHHERMDGSGYPHALSGNNIGTLGKLLGVADVTEAAIKRLALPRVEMLFRINRARFAPAMLDALRDLLHVTASDEHGLPSEEDTAAQLNHLGELLQAWFSLRAMLVGQKAPAPGDKAPLGFLFERMAQIRSVVLQAGMDPDNMSSMLAMTQDAPELRVELHAMLDEMDWLLRDLANEIDRRSPELTGLSQGALKDLQLQLRHPETAAAH